MPQKRNKLTPIQKEYNKQYKLYEKRIKSARESGYIIPEDFVKTKKEKPRTRDIEQLKKVNRKYLESQLSKRKIEYLSPFTGEIITGGRAAEISRQKTYISPYTKEKITRQPKTKKQSTYELVQEAKQKQLDFESWVKSPENVTRPTSTDEYFYVVDKVNDYIKKYNPPQSSLDWITDKRIQQEMETIRGPTFNYETFKETEKKYGRLFSDPNRPLDKDEIDYIQGKLNEESGTPDSHSIGEYIDELRGWREDYNYYDKYYENEKTNGNIPADLFEIPSELDSITYGNDWDRRERPEIIKRPSNEIGETPIETIALDNLIERVRNVELSGESYKSKIHELSTRDRIFKQMSEQNKINFEQRINNLIDKYGASYVDEAIKKANSQGRAFQEYFLYRGSIMGQYLTDIEHLLLRNDDYYNEADYIENDYEGW